MIEALLQKLELRDRLHPQERAALETRFGTRTPMACGAEIVRQHATPGESILLLDGVCGRQVTMMDGRQQTTAVHIAGDFVDLHSFLLRTMDHSVVALTDGAITLIPHAQLRDPRLASRTSAACSG